MCSDVLCIKKCCTMCFILSDAVSCDTIISIIRNHYIHILLNEVEFQLNEVVRHDQFKIIFIESFSCTLTRNVSQQK